jgi:hypothetical protein
MMAVSAAAAIRCIALTASPAFAHPFGGHASRTNICNHYAIPAGGPYDHEFVITAVPG